MSRVIGSAASCSGADRVCRRTARTRRSKREMRIAERRTISISTDEERMTSEIVEVMRRMVPVELENQTKRTWI